MISHMRGEGRNWPRACVAIHLSCVLTAAVRPAWADLTAFNYEPIVGTIDSATFSVGFGGLTAHRSVVGIEVNMASLIDVNAGLGEFDMSELLFGTRDAPLDPAQIDQGTLGTGIVTATVDSAFFDALTDGSVGLWFTFTDTSDGMFAIDFLSLEIQVTGGPDVEAFYGSANDFFGQSGMYGDDLSALPDYGSTGTGFDESISGKGGHKIPAPTSFSLALIGIVALVLRRR